MHDEPERYERLFEAIETELTKPEDHHTLCIVKALKIVAMELSDLNVVASELMDLPESLTSVVHHLEQIDAQTAVVATLAENKPGDRT